MNNILTILALIFVTLKLAGIGAVAGWSWWAVLSPIWGAWLVALFLLILAVVGHGGWDGFVRQRRIDALARRLGAA